MADFWVEHDTRIPETWLGRYTEGRPACAGQSDLVTYFVRVCGFTFRFQSLDELRHVLEFYRRKTHPSSRYAKPRDFRKRGVGKAGCGHTGCGPSCWQRWYERIPIKLQANARRERVVRALERALDEFSHKAPPSW